VLVVQQNAKPRYTVSYGYMIHNPACCGLHGFGLGVTMERNKLPIAVRRNTPMHVYVISAPKIFFLQTRNRLFEVSHVFGGKSLLSPLSPPECGTAGSKNKNGESATVATTGTGAGGPKLQLKLNYYRVGTHRNKVLFKKRNTDIGHDELGNGITRTHTSVVTSINQYELQYSSGFWDCKPLLSRSFWSSASLLRLRRRRIFSTSTDYHFALKRS